MDEPVEVDPLEAVGIVPQDLGKGLAAHGDARPGDHLAVAVLAEREGVDAARVDADQPAEERLEAGGVERGAGADHLAFGEAGELPDVLRDEVHRVGDDEEDA